MWLCRPGKKQPFQAAWCSGTILEELQTLLVEIEIAAYSAVPQPPLATAQASDTALILTAIEHSITLLLVHIDHLAEER